MTRQKSHMSNSAVLAGKAVDTIHRDEMLTTSTSLTHPPSGPPSTQPLSPDGCGGRGGGGGRGGSVAQAQSKSKQGHLGRHTHYRGTPFLRDAENSPKLSLTTPKCCMSKYTLSQENYLNKMEPFYTTHTSTRLVIVGHQEAISWPEGAMVFGIL